MTLKVSEIKSLVKALDEAKFSDTEEVLFVVEREYDKISYTDRTAAIVIDAKKGEVFKKMFRPKVELYAGVYVETV